MERGQRGFLAPVDREHGDLFRIADELQVAVTESAPPDTISEHLNRWAAYMYEHFSDEDWAEVTRPILDGGSEVYRAILAAGSRNTIA